MSGELAAAIKEAGLPAVEFDYARMCFDWVRRDYTIRLEVRGRRFSVSKLQGWAVLADAPYLPTAAEACAKVKEWMEGK